MPSQGCFPVQWKFTLFEIFVIGIAVYTDLILDI